MYGIARGLRRVREEDAFTLVELLIVVILSLIMLAGMVALVSSSFHLFNSSKDIQAISDTARRSLSSMSRQLRTALHVEASPDSGLNQLTFYADSMDRDISEFTGGVRPDVDSYAEAEKIAWSLNGTDLQQETVYPDVANPGQYKTITADLGSYVSSLNFYYFGPGVVPTATGNPANPYSNDYEGTEYNQNTGMIRIEMTMSKGTINRLFSQDVFLRVIERSGAT